MDDVSTSPPNPAPDPSAEAREAVLADLAGRAVPASLRPLSIISPSPLRPLPPKVTVRLDARVRAGLDPTGADHPRRETIQLMVLPVVLGAASAIALIVGLIISSTLLTIISALVLAASVAGGYALSSWVKADPLRLRHEERKALTNACYWESRQGWIGAIHNAPERAVVSLAADTAMQIAASPAWTSAYLDVHRSRFDLVTELDQIDAQAHQSATAHAGRPFDPNTDPSYLALVDRVAALRGYAAAIGVLGSRLAAAAASVDAELRGSPGALPGGQSADGSTQGLNQLTNEISYLNSSIADHIAASRANPGVTGNSWGQQ